MEKNYNFKINQPEPSRDMIRSHMDFDALLQQAEATPALAPNTARQARVRRLIYVASAAAAALLLLLTIPGLLDNDSVSPEAYFAQRDYVDRPLQATAMQVAYTTRNMNDAHKGGIIEYASGSRLVIPAAAFTTAKGDPVNGEVQIHYRELHDYIDFFVSGIPMAYDSVGMQRYLTSAGMVEIYAEQNGRRLRLANGKAIQVELRSEVPVQDYFQVPQFFVYQLDTTARTWRYRNIDIMDFVETDLDPNSNTPEQRWQSEMAVLEGDYQVALQQLQLDYPLPPAPVPPTQVSGNRPTLELDFTDGTLPLDPASDLQPEDLNYLHKGTIWEVAPESPAVNQNAFRVAWEKVRLRRLNTNRFELTLVHSQNEETLIVAPVLTGADYQRALANYEQEQAAYDAMVTLREEEIAASRDSLNSYFANRKLQLRDRLQESLRNSDQPLTREVINRFVLNEFGVWNCAQPINAPNTIKGVNYQTADGNAVGNTTAYVVNDRYNTVYRYLASDTAPLGLPAGNNLLWIVDENDNVAVTRLNENQLTEGVDVVLQTVAPPVQTQQELREVLDL